MKQLFLILAAFAINLSSIAQSLPTKTKQKTEQKVNQRADQKIDQGIDAALNKTEESIKNLFKKKSKDGESGSDSLAQDKNAPKVNSGKNVSQTSDFIPGVEVIFSDDFSQDAIGDFPAQWNTTGSGSVVEIDGNNWFQIVHNSIVNPVMDDVLPENSTIQFDLLLVKDGGNSTPFIQFGLTKVRDIIREDLNYNDRFFFNIHRYTESDGKTIEYGLQGDIIGNKSDFPLTSYVNEVLHVDMAVNKTRVRVYLDGQKLIDLPRVLTPDLLNNFFFNNNYVIPATQTPMYIGNVRIASAETDARSLLIKQLMEEGNASTSEIRFAVNSDVIEPASFAIIDQVGKVLVSNPNVNLKITGHTDSDGEDADNLALSINRANSVKTYLITKHGISGSRLSIDGKGESSPVQANTTAQGKAANRRVEFTKN